MRRSAAGDADTRHLGTILHGLVQFRLSLNKQRRDIDERRDRTATDHTRPRRAGGSGQGDADVRCKRAVAGARAHPECAPRRRLAGRRRPHSRRRRDGRTQRDRHRQRRGDRRSERTAELRTKRLDARRCIGRRSSRTRPARARPRARAHREHPPRRRRTVASLRRRARPRALRGRRARNGAHHRAGRRPRHAPRVAQQRRSADHLERMAGSRALRTATGRAQWHACETPALPRRREGRNRVGRDPHRDLRGHPRRQQRVLVRRRALARVLERHHRRRAPVECARRREPLPGRHRARAPRAHPTPSASPSCAPCG